MTVVSACLGLLSLNGADITWKGGDSTSPYDLAKPANWNGGSLPTSSDTVKLNASPDQPLTLSAESLTVGQIYIMGNTIDFDLGKDHAFYANAKVFFGNNNVDQVVTLKSGILGIYPDTSGDGRVFISDSYTGSRLVIVDGEDSIFQGCKKSTIILGQNYPNNTLIVRNGALLRGGINMGQNSAAAINNRVVITGLGSRYELPAGYTAGCTVGGGLGNRGNEFMVTNRATFTIANGTTLDLGSYYTGSDTGSGTLTFADHATGTANNDVYVGRFGSTNRLNVLSGSSFACSSHLNIGGCRADHVKDGRVSIDNEVRVAGEGSKLTVGGQVNIGRGAGSTDSRLIVENGATFVATNEALHVGYNASTNSLLAVRSGATFIGDNGCICIAVYQDSMNSKLVVDNATLALTNELKVGELLVGVRGRCGSLELRNHAMLSMTNIGITVGQKTEAVSNLIRIASGSTFFHSRTSDSSGNQLAIGNKAPYCGLEVDGGRLISSNDCISVGREATAHHTKMDILNDSYVDIHRLILGHDGSYNVVNVENSELRVRHSISAGNGRLPGQTNNVWRFSGSRTKVRQTWAGYGVYFNAGTEVEFNIPKAGLLVQPVIEAVGSVYFYNVTNSECRINVDPRYANGGRLVLIKASDIVIPDGYRFIVSPDAKLDLSVPGELAVKVKRKLGMTIVIK